MYPFMNEDAAWQRLQDTQREIENSRLMAEGQPDATLRLLRRLAVRAWHLAERRCGRHGTRPYGTTASEPL